MISTSFKTPLKHIQMLDDMVRRGYYNSRGDIIRRALADYLHEWNAFKQRRFDVLNSQKLKLQSK